MPKNTFQYITNTTTNITSITMIITTVAMAKNITAIRNTELCLPHDVYKCIECDCDNLGNIVEFGSLHRNTNPKPTIRTENKKKTPNHKPTVYHISCKI